MNKLESTELIKEFDENGVVLLKNINDSSLLEKVKEQYDYLNANLTRREIVKDKPLIVLWNHVLGETKRLATFDEFPALFDFINKSIVVNLRNIFPDRTQKLQLLETIIFQKPPLISNTLNWHQDVAYFPLKPNNQIAVWIPFEIVTKERGAMNYALGSHKLGIRGSTNLHTREKFNNEDRELIPDDPSQTGLTLKTFEMTPDDMLIHDGFTWHYSGPNIIPEHTRRGLSVRFITQDAYFDPRPGQGAAFTSQIDCAPGDLIVGPPFPYL